jgi:hypothetical protein
MRSAIARPAWQGSACAGDGRIEGRSRLVAILQRRPSHRLAEGHEMARLPAHLLDLRFAQGAVDSGKREAQAGVDFW